MESRPGALGGFFAFLFGRRAAIEAIALGRGSILVGLLLTVSAGLARTYDTQSLLHQPWMALRGIPVALLNSLALFAIVYGVARPRNPHPARFWPTYLAFLAAFLWTAPLAWLYAIPYERFLTPIGALHANLWTLGAVALWRVLLIGRVLSILLGRPYVPILLWTLLWSDIVVFAATVASDVPIIDIMGALQHSPEDAAAANAAFLTGQLSLLALPVLLVAALVGLRWMRARRPAQGTARQAEVSRGAFRFAAVCVAAGLALLPLSQGEQVRKHRVEVLLRAGRVGEAMAQMSAHNREDYPPVWDPPPRMGYREQTPTEGAICEAMAALPPAPWVRDLFLPKIRLGLRRMLPFQFARANTWTEIAGDVAEVGISQQFGSEIVHAAAFLAANDPTLSDTDREALRSIAHTPIRDED